jgi:predicted dienelactone hydrolase
MRNFRFPAALIASVALAALGTACAPAGGPAPRHAPSAAARGPTTPTRPTPAPVQLTLPAPTGQDRIGVVSLHLIDHSRTDPWVPGHQVRQLMISIWYPARRTAGFPATPWMEPGAAAVYERHDHIPAGLITPPVTHGHQNAPVATRPGGRPVVLFSPADRLARTFDTALVEDLASHGYIVVTIDHTHDAGEVEFPGGHVAVGTLPPDSNWNRGLKVNTKATAVRVADTRFVLGQLAALNAGHNPDAEHHRLPRGLASALNLADVGMFGFSMGGATAAGTMLADPRIKAGIDLDGTLYGPVVTKGLNRPFLLISSDGPRGSVDDTWVRFWAHLRGWRLNLRIDGTTHLSFCDLVTLLHQAAPVLHLTPAQLAQRVGTINPGRAIAIERAYILAFFDLQLRHHNTHLLDHPSAAYPEVQFIP